MGEKRGMVKPERHKDEVAVLIISFVLLSSAIWEAPDFGHMLTSAIDCMVVFFYNRICTREFLMLYVRGRAVYQFGAALIKLGLKKWKQWEFLKVSGNINFGYIGGVVTIALTVLILICCLCRMLYIRKSRLGLKDGLIRKMQTGQLPCVQLGIATACGLLTTYEGDEKVRKYIITPIIYALLLLMAYGIGSHTVNEAERFEERKILETLAAGWKETFHQKDVYYGRMGRTVHDLKNELLGLRFFLLTEKYSQACKYLDAILKKFDGNTIGLGENMASWELLIDSKGRLAEEKGIDFQVKILVDECIGMDEMDLCVILGNLLDNAIEAQENVEGQKYIVCEMKQRCHLLAIRISNPIADERVGKPRLLKSEKRNKLIHGIGLKSIEEKIRKYNGYFKIKIERQSFIVEVSMHLADMDDRI